MQTARTRVTRQRGESSERTHLVFLFESVTLGALHLRDVLEEIGHADGRVKLPRLVRDVHGLALLVGVSVRLHQAAGLAVHGVVLVCREKGEGERVSKRRGKRRRNG